MLILPNQNVIFIIHRRNEEVQNFGDVLKDTLRKNGFSIDTHLPFMGDGVFGNLKIIVQMITGFTKGGNRVVEIFKTFHNWRFKKLIKLTISSFSTAKERINFDISSNQCYVFAFCKRYLTLDIKKCQFINIARAATAAYSLTAVYNLTTGQLESAGSVLVTTERSRVFIYDKSATPSPKGRYDIDIINNML